MRLTTGICSFFIPFFCTGPGLVSAQSVEQLVAEGLRADSTGNYKTAVKLFSSAIEKEPELSVAWYNRGVSRMKMKQHSLALVDLNRCIFLDTGNIDAYYNRSFAYRKTSNFQFALADISHYLKRRPADKDAYYYLFDLLCEMQEWNDVIDCARHLNSIAGEDDTKIGPDLMAVFFEKAGQTDSALAAMNLAVQRTPSNTLLRLERAHMLHRFGKFEQSMQDLNFFTNMERSESTEKEIRKLRADNFFYLKDFDAAAVIYTELIASDTMNSSLKADYGHCLLQLEKYEQAETMLTSAIRLKNDAPAYAYLGRGIARQNLGRGQDACDDWQKSLLLGEKRAALYLEKFCKSR
jgi:tetratricopeptide (TPR) repeat protein